MRDDFSKQIDQAITAVSQGGARLRSPTVSEQVGMAWWNRLSEAERAYWLRVADSARPVDAYAAYCRHADRDAAVADSKSMRGF